MRKVYKIRRVLKQSILFFVFGVLISCLTPLNFPADIGMTQIVISGQVSTISERNIVTIGKTADSQRLPFPVLSATVTLIDEFNSSFPYIENQNKPGQYSLDGYIGKPGHIYFINVVLPNGEVYQSATERMPLASGEIATSYSIEKESVTDNEGIVIDQNFLKVYIDSKLPNTDETRYFKWSVDEVFALVPTDFPDFLGMIPPPCYISQSADPQRVVLFNGEEVSTSVINKNLVASRLIDYSFIDRHYFTTYQSALTKDAFEYWRKVNILANQVGSIFDSPPAKITGNITNVRKKTEDVLGYFQANNESYDRFFILKSDLPFPLLLTDCQYDERDYTKYPQRCLDCIEQRNSSYVRPSWF